jgi:hypothetical protein
LIYEQPRLIRFSDVIDWSQGQYDDPFSRCETGSALGAGSPYADCGNGSSAYEGCYNGPNTTPGYLRHCSTGSGFDFGQFPPGKTQKCQVGTNPG